MISRILFFFVLFPLMLGWRGADEWQLLDYEYYSIELPSSWIFKFGGKDKMNIHKRNIVVGDDKSEKVKYELGTLVWGTEVKKSEDFGQAIYVEIRSFRKLSGDAVSMDEVCGKVPEASWPEYMQVQMMEEGGIKRNAWKKYLLKGETKGFSVETGAFTSMIWDYKFFMEKNGMVFCLTVTMPDMVRASSLEYDKMACRIIKSFKVK